jgi:hypothetical protein
VNRPRQTVREIFGEALAKNANRAPASEIRAFILRAAHHNRYDVTESVHGDTFKIRFPTGQTISFDGRELRLGPHA